MENREWTTMAAGLALLAVSAAPVRANPDPNAADDPVSYFASKNSFDAANEISNYAVNPSPSASPAAGPRDWASGPIKGIPVKEPAQNVGISADDPAFQEAVADILNGKSAEIKQAEARRLQSFAEALNPNPGAGGTSNGPFAGASRLRGMVGTVAPRSLAGISARDRGRGRTPCPRPDADWIERMKSRLSCAFEGSRCKAPPLPVLIERPGPMGNQVVPKSQRLAQQ